MKRIFSSAFRRQCGCLMVLVAGGSPGWAQTTEGDAQDRPVPLEESRDRENRQPEARREEREGPEKRRPAPQDAERREKPAAEVRETREGDMRAHMEEVGRDLRQAVENGRISPEEARRKMASIREEHMRRMQAENQSRVMNERLERAVAEGKLSKEEAREKLAAMHRERAEGAPDRPPHREQQLREEIVRGVHAAVRLGRINEREAEEYIRMLTVGREESRELEAQMHRGLDAAVELGSLHPEEAARLHRQLAGDPPPPGGPDFRPDRRPTPERDAPRPPREGDRR